MDCTGIDLVHPIDRMPPGSFAFLFNTRVIQEGRIDGRPGYTNFISLQSGDFPNSIRRLNDPDMSYAASGYTYVGGGGTKLYAGTESTPPYTIIDTGYSGNPLSLLTFRPDQSPESWMYVFDQNKLVKVRPDGVTRAIGVAPPTDPPDLELGTPAMVTISDGEALGSWTAGGSATGPTLVNRISDVTTPTIGVILYNSGSTGWCCLSPTGTGNYSQIGARARVFLNAGGGNQEAVAVREIHEAIADSTIAGIAYDSGTTGLATIVLAGSPNGLDRNSFVTLGVGGGTQETVRALSVTSSADGVTYSFRAVTANAHVAGETTAGLLSWYVYTTLNHVTTEAISVHYISGGNSTSGASTATLSLLTAVDAGKANGRPISVADDYMHLSFLVGVTANIASLSIQIDVDANTSSLGNAFTGNYYTWTVLAAQLVGGDATWTELVLPLSQAVRSGGDLTRNFSNIAAIQVSATLTDLTEIGLDCWYFFGTYGPVIQPNSPVGLSYQSRFRDSTTGAHSLPGPQTRYELFPLREQVLVTPEVTDASGVDQIDIYRLGGTVSQFLYVGSVADNFASPNTYSDSLPDSAVLSANSPPDLGAVQPWPILQTPRSGVVNVNGTTVTRVSGDPFDLNLLSATIMLINGTAYQTFGQPSSADALQLFLDGGVQTGVPYQIASPTLAAQPLPFVFGPLEGPFQPVAFALGDSINSGTLYFSNLGDLDSASDQNSLELTGPSEPLISGADWNGLVFVGSRDNIYLVRYSFLQSPSTYQDQKIPSTSGMWSRWSCCSCPLGVAFLGRDGLYIATPEGSKNITDEKLYPLFPHDGQPASAPVNIGGNIILPVDMSRLESLRLAYLDGDLIFSYLDTGNNSVSLRYEFAHSRWFLNTYAAPIWTQYLIEGSVSAPASPEILLLARNDSKIFLAGADDDAGSPINSQILTPALDTGDERGQKLYVDSMTMAEGTGTLELATAYNNAQVYSPILNIPCVGTVQQTLQNISSLANLSLYRNVCAKFAWTGGPSGPKVIAWEVSGYLQPYVSKFFVTQYINLSFPGWKHHRRLYAGLISNSVILLTVKTDDGRTYGPYAIQSTNGQFKIQPVMLDQGIKALSFAYQLDGGGQNFSLFPGTFTIETKSWTEDSYIDLAVFKA